MSSPRPGDLSAGFIGLAVSVIFLLATVTTIIALTNRAFAGHAASPQAGHATPPAQSAPAGREAPGGEQPAPQPPAGQTPPAAHAPGAH